MRAAALIFLFLTVSSLFGAETSEAVRVPAIADLNRIIREKKPKPGVYRFSGLVISVQDSLIFLLDESGCANVKFDPSESDIPRAGDVLDITVRRCMSGMPLECVRREKTGRREIPEPVEISGHDTAGWKFLYQYVRVRGVIAGSIPDELDSRFYWTVLRTPTGPVLFATDRRHDRKQRGSGQAHAF